MNDTTARRLVEVVRAFLAIEAAGALPDLRDSIAALRWRQRKDRQQQPIGMTPWLRLMADELARMTELPVTQWETAFREAIGLDWPSAACAEIEAFAARLEQPTEPIKPRRVIA
jgi:hypothetical protein